MSGASENVSVEENDNETTPTRHTRSSTRNSSSKSVTRSKNRKSNTKTSPEEECEEEKNSMEIQSEVSRDEQNEEEVKEINGVDDETKKESMKMEDSDVPELDAPIPPVISNNTATKGGLKLRTSLQSSETDVKKEEDNITEEFTVIEEVASDSDDVQEVLMFEENLNTREEVEKDSFSPEAAPHAENIENMTVIDEVTDEAERKADSDIVKDETSVLEPDAEMVSEDELPAEMSKEQLDTEAVSDEELPTNADLPETEAVSEDELPLESAEKKKIKKKKTKNTSLEAKGDQGTEGTDNKKSETVKRKLPEGEYDPSSPTSEASNDESPPNKKVNTEGKTQSKPAVKVNKMLPELEKYWKAVKEDPTDFTGWTYLLQYVDQENDVDAAREAYDAFLSHYPYCYGYWRKYADYEKRKGNKRKCEEVFERGLKAIPLSVDLWIHYLNYCKTAYAEDEQFLRDQFEKALDACGLEFRSDRLWEAYIKWESEGKHLQNITALYDRLLATPTQGYNSHFETFQEHVSNNPPNKVLSVDEFLTLRHEVLQLLKQYDTPLTDATPPGEDDAAPPGEEPPEAVTVGSVEETTALRERIVAIRRKIHKATVSAVAARWNYEEGIKRPYFHVKPLERCQLKNWKEYIDYEIEQGDQKRIIVLFERCLVACALYDEFWMKYIRYLEECASDMTDKIRDVYERACTIHHTKKPNLHLHWAVYEEKQGNYAKAADILNNLEKLVPNLMQVTYRRINLARRSGNLEMASQLYEQYISQAKNRVFANNMSIKYARFCWKILDNVDKAVTVLKKAVEKDKENPRLYLQLIDMAIQKNPMSETEVVNVMDQFLSRESAELEQKVMFAQRKIEFLEDFGSDVKSVQKATDEFQRLLKQLKDRKKKNSETDSKGKQDDSVSNKKSKGNLESKQDASGVTHSNSGSHVGQTTQQSQPQTAASQYTAPSYNQPGSYSQPPAQSGYQGGQYPQQPPYSQPPYNQQYNQSDPNYANYQNWSYSQTGYGNYNQGWGGYNYY